MESAGTIERFENCPEDILTGHWDEADVEDEEVGVGDGCKVVWEVGGKAVVGADCDVDGLGEVGWLELDVGWVDELEPDVGWLGELELDVGWVGELELDVGWLVGDVGLGVGWLVDDVGQVGGAVVEGTVSLVTGAGELEVVVALVELLKHPIKSTVMLWAPWLGVILMAVTSLLKVSINWPLSTV